MKHLILYGLFFSVVLSSCYREINLDKYRKDPILVLNGRIIADSVISVVLTHSWFASDVVSDVSVTDAEISLLVNEEYKENLKFIKVETGDDVFVSEYRPSEGDYIRLVAVSVEYGTAIAEEKVPQRTKIEHINITHQWSSSNGATIVEGGSVSTHMGHEFIYSITFRDRPGEKNYYYFEIRSANDSSSVGYMDYSREPVFLAQEKELDVIFELEGRSGLFYRVFSDDLFDGEEYTLTISEMLHYFNNLETIEREVILHTIPESYYKYQFSLEVLRSEGVIKKLSDIGFADPIRIYSNVEGGTGFLATSATSSFLVEGKDNS